MATNDVSSLNQSLRQSEAQMQALTAAADGFGAAISAGLRAAVVDGKALDDVLRGVLLKLSDRALTAALAPLSDLLGGLAGSLAGSLVGALTEGASSRSAGSERAATTVHFHVTTPDAESFRRSEAQLSAMLARSVGRGRRAL